MTRLRCPLRTFSLLLPALVLLLAAAGARADDSAERAFSAARTWTVQVVASVARPFIEDEQGTGEGSGLLVDAERGWVLTNAHVASHSPAVLSIAFVDGLRIPAQALYVDPYLDLAVVAFDPAEAKHALIEPPLECDAVPAVGHPVGAFGHPWGYRFTGTRGIASAVTSRYGPDMLQTDAPINSGNSGGPLISLVTGKVVGVSSATVAKSEAEGLSFAVPMPYACTLLDILRAGRDPSPPQALLDFAFNDYDEASLTVARTRLPAGSLALEPDDRVLAVGERAVATPTEFYDAVRGQLDALVVTVERDGRELTLQGSLPPAPRVTERRGLVVGGVLFADAEAHTGGMFNLNARLMVHNVDAASPASEFAYFDLLLGLDGEEVDSLETLETLAARAAAEQRPASLRLLRLSAEGNQFFVYHRRALDTREMERVGAW